jgi:hypothetical protein
LEEDDGRTRKRQREKWRRNWISRFAERQRTERRWIAFVDLADWGAHSTTTASAEAELQARELVYCRLSESILTGAFEQAGRSKILYLDPRVGLDGASPRCRLTRVQFEVAVAAAAMRPGVSAPLIVLGRCWLPRELARHWLKSHGYRCAPHFEPVQDEVPFMRTGAPGRPSRGMHLVRREFDQRRIANECKPSLREEATELERWFHNFFPTAQPVKRKTIENNIRSDYRDWAAGQSSER